MIVYERPGAGLARQRHKGASRFASGISLRIVGSDGFQNRRKPGSTPGAVSFLERRESPEHNGG